MRFRRPWQSIGKVGRSMKTDHYITFFFSTKLIKYYRLYIILINKYSCIVCYIRGNICLYIIAILVVIFIFVIHGEVTENNFCYSTGMSFLLVSSF